MFRREWRQQLLEARLQADEQALGPTAIEALAWSAKPAGVSWRQLHPGQRELQTALIGATSNGSRRCR
jgi:hypothetical protein